MGVRIEKHGKTVASFSTENLKKQLGSNKKKNAKIKKELTRRGVLLED